MAVIPGEVVRRAIAPKMTPAAPPRVTGANPLYTRVNAGPAATDVTSGSRPGNPGYGSYTLPPDPNLLAKIVSSDPNVMAAQLGYNTGAGQADALLRGQLSTNLIDYGDTNLASQLAGMGQTLDPQLASALGNMVDPNTVAAAQANTAAGHSQLALLNLDAAHAADQMYSHLAATGGLQSGELGFEQGLNSASDSLARYRALTNLTNTLSGDVSTQINTKQNLQDTLTNAINQAKVSGNMPGPTNVTVGNVPAAPHANLGGSTGLAPGTYTNTSAGLPNYQLTPMGSLSPGTYYNASAGAPSYKPVPVNPFPGGYNATGASLPHYIAPSFLGYGAGG